MLPIGTILENNRNNRVGMVIGENKALFTDGKERKFYDYKKDWVKPHYSVMNNVSVKYIDEVSETNKDYAEKLTSLTQLKKPDDIMETLRDIQKIADDEYRYHAYRNGDMTLEEYRDGKQVTESYKLAVSLLSKEETFKDMVKEVQGSADVLMTAHVDNTEYIVDEMIDTLRRYKGERKAYLVQRDEFDKRNSNGK